MTTRRSILISAVLVAGGVLWYLFRPEALIVNRHVSEPFPATATAMSSMADGRAMADSPAMSSMAHPSAMADSSAMGGHSATARAPGAHDPAKLLSGRFHTNAHKTNGLATIYRLANGSLVLRLTQFATSNGPEVRVYLVAATDVQDEASAKQAGFVDLGALKGNIGDQNYDVPATVDLTKYRAVSIWCRRFSVNFGAAPLVEAM